MIWKECIFDHIFSFKGDGFLGKKVLWRGHFYYFVNVHSSCCIIKKRSMWKEILELKRKYGDGEWCVGGDFNFVVSNKETKLSFLVNMSSEMSLFFSLLRRSNFQICLMRITFLAGITETVSLWAVQTIYLISDALIDRCGIVGQLIDKREIFYHCPICIMINKDDWGPKPFRVLDCQFDNKDFISFIEEEWKSISVVGVIR